MNKLKLFMLIFVFLLCVSPVCLAITRNSYTKYGKHIMPTYYDPYFIRDFENCTPNDYMDWTGTYRYVIEGRDERLKVCKYKSQYNQWLKKNKNVWEDYKACNFNDARMRELSDALKEHSGQISSYNLGPYKTTGTKLEYLLYSYEYYGACKLIWKKNKPVGNIQK